jgi:amino acid adenylation domain-containing protein
MTETSQIKEVAALTAMQRALLHRALLEPASPVYHEQLLLRFDGPVDAARLQDAWQQVVDRHDGLRGRFLGQRVSNPVHLIPRREAVTLRRHALQVTPAPAGEGLPQAVEDFLRRDQERPFDLENEHPMRLALLQSGDGTRHWLVWSFHHILLDGWSIGLVLDEVLRAYGGESLPAAADPAGWRRWLAGREREPSLQFWRDHLAGCEAEGLAPATGEVAPLALARAEADAATARALRGLAAAQRCSPHHLLLAAWALVVGRFTDQTDVVIPTVLAGRPEEVPGADAMVGLFINTVPMRVRWRPEESFTTLLQRTREASVEAARHQHLSLADVQAATGALPVDHLLLLQGVPGLELRGRACGGARIAATDFREVLPFDLTASISPGDAAIVIEVQGRHAPGWLQALAEGASELLARVAARPEAAIRALLAGSTGQRAQVLRWGDGGPAPTAGTLLAAMDAQCARAPDAPALVAGETRWSHRELHARANRLAHRLLAAGPLAAQAPVGLLAHRDAGLLAGLVAILRAGATYLPLDPEHPPERIRRMLAAAGCRHVLLSPGLENALPEGFEARRILLEDAEGPGHAPERAVTPEQLAYVIFTSGSTGLPKGVQITHASAAAALAAIRSAIGVEGSPRVLAATTVSFDISIVELLGPLTWGGTVVLASAEEARDASLQLALARREAVTLVQATPTRLHALFDADRAAPAADRVLPRLRQVLVGGEALPAELAADLLALAPVRAFNVYGPTECAIWSTCWPVAPGPARLGRALAGERVLVLSREREPQPPWAWGELAIAGAGVARGYAGDPARTAERFVTLPGSGERAYLTGDIARWRGDDGTLEGRGRRDEQIKLRGMRIELGEIEQHLRALPGVRAAAAAVRRGANARDELVGYLVGPAAVETAAWRARLAAQLPAAMVPSRFMCLPALPVTASGKTDRQALPAPPDAAHPESTAASSPPSAAAGAIAAVFSELLARPVGPEEDFFAAGGHSLLAIQAIGRINRALPAGYGLADLYRHPSAAALARTPRAPGLPLRAGPPAADYPLSAQQQALWVLDQLQPGYAGYHIPGAYLVTGALDAAQLERAWAAVVARHAALRTVFTNVGGAPRQRVLGDMPFTIERHFLPPGADAGGLVREITRRPFALDRGPLFRLALIQLARECHVFVLVLHHIIGDGWSDAVLTPDLEAAWNAVRRGADARAALPPAPALGYGDFALWQERYLASPLAAAHRSHWEPRLADLPRLALPASGRRAAQLERPGARHAFTLPAAAAAEWLARCPTAERYAALAATTLALLHVAGGQQDIVLGLPIANRDRPQLQDQAGLHVNMLPLRQAVRPGLTLAQLQAQCRDAIVEAMAHADYPFARLVQDLGLTAPPGRHPVCDAILIFHQHPVPLPRLEGLQLAVFEDESYLARFDLDFEVWVDGGAVRGFIEYDSGLFSAEDVAALARRWQELLVASPQQPLSRLRPAAAPAAQHAELDEEF